MKLDWEIVRQILTDVEKLTPSERNKFSISVSREDAEEKHIFIEHFFLLKSAGFVKGADTTTLSGKGLLAPDLTWEGHQLLATIRSKPVWEKIKSTAQDKGLDLSFEAIAALGKAAIAAIVASVS